MPDRYSNQQEMVREDGVRLEKLRTDIAARLGNACCELSAEDFALLVDKIARVQLRGERRAF